MHSSIAAPAAPGEAMLVPLEVCEKTHEAMKLCMPLAKKGNINLITDVGDAAIMLEAAFQSAILNVEINLKAITDEKFVRGVREKLEPIAKEITAVKNKVKTEVEKHLK